MAEEIQAVDSPNNEPQDKQYTALEQEAMSQGWVPEEEFEGDPERFVSAKEFIQRGEFFKKIEAQGKQIREQARMLDHLAKLNKQSFEAGIKKAMDDLKKAKKEAFAEGDADRLVEIDEQMLALKEQEVQARATAQPIQQIQQEVHPELQAWMQRNPWYERDIALKGAADAIGVQLAQSGMSPADVLKEVEKRVKADFPNKFHNPNRERAGTVEGSTGGRRGGKDGDVELSELERGMMNRLVKAGVLTEKEYKDQIKRINGVS